MAPQHVLMHSANPLTDIGSADNLVEQGLDLKNTASKNTARRLLVATKPDNTCFESLLSSRSFLIFT